MTLYIIRGHIVTAFASAPATSEDELRVRSVEEVEGSGLSAAQMVAIWNALPGTKPLSKFDQVARAGSPPPVRARQRRVSIGPFI